MFEDSSDDDGSQEVGLQGVPHLLLLFMRIISHTQIALHLPPPPLSILNIST